MTEQVSTVRSYRPGGWFGIFGKHASVLLPPSEKARVAALWELVDAGSDFGELLDALIASGLRGLPGFVLVSSGDEPTRVVLRGAARGHFTVADGEPVEVDGGAAATWVEKILHGVTSVRFELEDGGGADDYVLETGLVRVSRVDEPPHSPSVEGVDTEPFSEVEAVPAQRVDAVVETDEAVQSVPSDGGSSVPAGAVAPVVVPLGELSDAESVAESAPEVPPTVEEADRGAETEAAEETEAGAADSAELGGAPFAAYAEEPAAEEPAAEEPAAEEPAAEPAGPADEPTERFDPMAHEAGDYDPAPVGPFAAHAEDQAVEEPAAEEPAAEEPAASRSRASQEPGAESRAAEEPEELHWPFSDPEDTGEQPVAPRRQGPRRQGPRRQGPRRRSPRGVRPRATSTPRRRRRATRSPPTRRPHRRRRHRRSRRSTTTTATPSRAVGTPAGSLGNSPASRASRRRRASPRSRWPGWCSPAARPSTSIARC